MGKRMMVAAAVLAMLAVAAPGRAETPVEKRLRVLEQQLHEAQDEIKRLRGQVEQQRAVGQATQRQVEQNAEETKTAVADTKKGLEVGDWVKRTTVFGDVRARHEGFYHQPHTEGQDVNARNRERIRARLGVRVAFSDELSATIRGASGNINDPISTNETLTNNFNRKSFNLDWAYLTFAPGATFGLRPGVAAITAGKFPNPMFRVGEMLFDDDLSPEGASETFQLLSHPLGALDQVKLYGLQWTFDEISNSEDGWMFGGQINPTMHFGDVQVEAGIGQFWWLNSDLIAQDLDKNTTSFNASGMPIANPNFNSSLANTNLLTKTRVRPPPLANGTVPAPFDVITGYESAFNVTNLDVGVTFPHVVANQPLRLFADYIYNWEAATDDAHGWQVGARLGQTKVRGDWSLVGFYEHIGQEAAISAFTYSDFGSGGTNLEGPVAAIEYQLLNPLTLTAKSHFTNFINRPAGMSNPTLTRLQLDALVKF
jgi:Putative porin